MPILSLTDNLQVQGGFKFLSIRGILESHFEQPMKNEMYYNINKISF